MNYNVSDHKLANQYTKYCQYKQNRNPKSKVILAHVFMQGITKQCRCITIQQY